ncbi:zinc-binding dehydrogenase [Kutzneria sp. NPDC051319]|uniref:zinc-binding dehydrogenase n=1 Tax=Kutzneria sp. NPDC051319 TaxID=3155047 RepID=UPI00341EA317
MRAIMASRFGGPEVLALVDLPTPDPAEGQFRVAVGRVGVGWLDAQIRRGLGPAGFGVTPPYVPGGGVAGTVTAVGSGVDVGWLGARVVTRPLGGYGGGYADTVISAPEASFLVPASVDLGDALAVLDDGSTALALLERTPVRAGDRVLVAPGVGGLGSLLVQLVTAAGATAVAAVRGEQKMALAKELRAEAVDYSAPSWATRVGRPDVVFDGVGGETGAAALALLGDGGRFSGYGMASGAETHVGAADRQRLTVSNMSQLPTFWADAPRRVEHVLAEVAEGRLTPVIGQTYPLAEAAAAHADIEARRFVGKLLLLP